MIATSTGMAAQMRPKNGARSLHIGEALGRVGGLRQMRSKRERHQQVGEIVEPRARDGLPAC
jgi:hypothetical protein